MTRRTAAQRRWPTRRQKEASSSAQGRRLREQLTEALRNYESAHFGDAYVYGDDLDGELSDLHERWWALPVEFITADEQETYESAVELVMERASDSRERLSYKQEPKRRKRSR